MIKSSMSASAFSQRADMELMEEILWARNSGLEDIEPDAVILAREDRFHGLGGLHREGALLHDDLVGLGVCPYLSGGLVPVLKVGRHPCPGAEGLGENRRLKSRLKKARLRQQASVEDVDYRHPRGLDKTLMAWID